MLVVDVFFLRSTASRLLSSSYFPFLPSVVSLVCPLIAVIFPVAGVEPIGNGNLSALPSRYLFF